MASFAWLHIQPADKVAYEGASWDDEDNEPGSELGCIADELVCQGIVLAKRGIEAHNKLVARRK